ncbi:MAG: hypothetical protein ACKPKO_65340, partial [Candidatus Fonsibacter sp.]
MNNVVDDDPLFKRQKRLNELFYLNKSYNTHQEMTPHQVLMWCNSLLEDFSLLIRADKETYYLELQNDLLALIKRQNNIGQIYYDKDNLLKQGAPNQHDNLFIDDEPPQSQETPAYPPQPQRGASGAPARTITRRTSAPRARTASRGARYLHSDSIVCRVETGDGALQRVVAIISRFRTVEAEDGALRRVITRLMNLGRTFIQYTAERDLYHLLEKQTRVDRVIPNTPYYRS